MGFSGTLYAVRKLPGELGLEGSVLSSQEFEDEWEYESKLRNKILADPGFRIGGINGSVCIFHAVDLEKDGMEEIKIRGTKFSVETEMISREKCISYFNIPEDLKYWETFRENDNIYVRFSSSPDYGDAYDEGSDEEYEIDDEALKHVSELVRDEYIAVWMDQIFESCDWDECDDLSGEYRSHHFHHMLCEAVKAERGYDPDNWQWIYIGDGDQLREIGLMRFFIPEGSALFYRGGF